MTTPHQPQPHTDGISDEVRVSLAKEHVRQNFMRGEPWSMTIARAILSERARCAGIAEAWKGHPADFHFAGKQIAAAILSPSTTQSQNGEIDNERA